MQFMLHLDDEEATKRFGEDLALALKKGDLITLQGDLGAGKSTLARALIRTLADDDMLDVPSPTFTLVQSYEDQRLPVAHADLYRISVPEEIDELGLDQAREDGVVVIEWPQKAEDTLPQPQFAITLIHSDKGRNIIIEAEDDAGKRLERSLKIREFLAHNNYMAAKRRYLAGDASPRGYETIANHGETRLLMDAPHMEFAETGKRTYAQIAHLAADMAQFVGIGRLLLEHGFAAPEIYGQDLETGLLIMEDLGREGLLDHDGLPVEERYLAAADLLAEFHQKDWPCVGSWNDIAITIPAYDRDALHIETGLLFDWYLPYQTNTRVTDALRTRYSQIWDGLFDLLDKAPKTLVMRDYHSPNLIWREDLISTDRLGLIDFQDALIGPTAYDLASLGQDARVTVTPALEVKIIDAYCRNQSAINAAFDTDFFRKTYAIMGAQRVSKILGIFVRLDKRDGKPHYLKHLPRLIDYLNRNLEHPALSTLKTFYCELGIID